MAKTIQVSKSDHAISKSRGSVSVSDASKLTPTDALYLATEREIDRLFPTRSIGRVLLILPPDGGADLFHFAGVRNRRYHNNPPYGLGVLAAHLRREGIDVQVLNLNNAILRSALQAPDKNAFDYERVITEHVEHAISSFKPDLIGLSAMFSVAHKSTLQCCELIRKFAPDTPIALGGVHFTNSFHSTVTRDILLGELKLADLVFMFEAEIAFRDFVGVVNRKKKVSDLAQVAFIRNDPVIHFDNRAVPAGDDLDLTPAFDLLELDQMSAHGNVGALHFLVPQGTRIATSLSNRGCRAKCTFCSVRQFNGVGVRGRSVQAVVDELLVLKHKHGIQHIVWLDDDFLFDHRRTLALFDEMVRRDVGMTWDWSNGVIAASCTDEIISAAAAAGCVGLFIGMESGNPHILKMIKKPGNVRHFLQAAHVLRKYEQINTRVYLMFGFPGETFGMIRDTIKVARDMGLDWNAIHPLQPLPNTPIYESVAEYRDFSDVTFAHSDYSKKTQVAVKIGDVLAVDFEDVFEENDSKKIPSPDQYDTIWANMFFHLNYERLFAETRPAKLLQAYRYIDRMAHLVVPFSGFAWYFRNYLFHKLHGHVDAEGRERLTQLMGRQDFYEGRFRQLSMPMGWFEARDGKLSAALVADRA
jgi:radical SAM superfamily enzyme YgiQ (UPF0313 family)